MLRLAGSGGVLIAACLCSSLVIAKPYHEIKEPMAPQITSGIVLSELSSADQDDESRLGLELGYRYSIAVETFSLLAQLRLLPDLSQDTADFSVYRSEYSLALLPIYNFHYLFRFFAGAGPRFAYKRLRYDFRGQKESFQDYDTSVDILVGLDYAISENLGVELGLNWQYELASERVNSHRSLALSFRL